MLKPFSTDVFLLVGMRGFEPPTPASEGRVHTDLNPLADKTLKRSQSVSRVADGVNRWAGDPIFERLRFSIECQHLHIA